MRRPVLALLSASTVASLLGSGAAPFLAQDTVDADGRTPAQQAARKEPEAVQDRPGHHHGFSEVERWAKEFEAPERAAWQKPAEVVTLAGVAAGMTVADLGAGTGYFLPYLSPAVGPTGKVLALDVEPQMVDFLWGRVENEGLSNVEPRVVAADDPGLAPASVDRILIVDTWHHIDARVTYTGKLAAALEPGGAVVVVDFTKEAPHGPPPAHRLTAEEVVAELAAGGLAARILDEDLPYQYVVVGSRPEAGR